MALGSQEQKIVMEDLVKTAKKAKKVLSKRRKQKSKKSPIRFKSKAKKDLDWADSRPKNSLIKKYDINPIISHLTTKK